MVKHTEYALWGMAFSVVTAFSVFSLCRGGAIVLAVGVAPLGMYLSGYFSGRGAEARSGKK